MARLQIFGLVCFRLRRSTIGYVSVFGKTMLRRPVTRANDPRTRGSRLANAYRRLDTRFRGYDRRATTDTQSRKAELMGRAPRVHDSRRVDRAGAKSWLAGEFKLLRLAAL
jgi:hypothetical protein